MHFDSARSSEGYYFCLPLDVVKLLVCKDEDGRTLVFRTHCKFVGHKGTIACDCPKGLARRPVDSIIGKLCAIFANNDRVGPGIIFWV